MTGNKENSPYSQTSKWECCFWKWQNWRNCWNRKSGKSAFHAIENVYDVLGLKHYLLSISQICDKRNNVLFTSADSTVTNTRSGNLVLKKRRHDNVYKVDIMDPLESELTCLNAMTSSSLLWHRKLSYTSFSLINKLIAEDLVSGPPRNKMD